MKLNRWISIRSIMRSKKANIKKFSFSSTRVLKAKSIEKVFESN
jgi:hypothetical protein